MTAPPKIDLVAGLVYRDQGTRKLLAPGEDLTQTLGARELDREEAEVPIGVAVANRGTEPLTDVGVQISYPSGLRVKSRGQRGEGPDGTFITYENAIGTINADDDSLKFTEDIDKLRLPFTLFVVRTVVMAGADLPGEGGGTPLLAGLIVAGFGRHLEDFSELRIPLHVRIFAGGRSLARFSARLRVPLLVHVDPENAATEKRPLRDLDRRLARRVAGSALPRARRLRGTLDRGERITYHETRVEGDALQVIRIDGRIRRVIVDRKADGLADYELRDLSGDGQVDRRLHYKRRPHVERWRSEWLRSTPKSTR